VHQGHLKKKFIWHSGVISGASLHRLNQWHLENHLYFIHPSQWKFIDKHLKMVIIIYMRGYEQGTRFTCDRIEAMTGVAGRTLRRFLKEAALQFPEWYTINNPPRNRCIQDIARERLRTNKGLSNRGDEWKKYKGHTERLMLIEQERKKGNKKMSELAAIFNCSSVSIRLYSTKTLTSFMDIKLSVVYGVKNKEIREMMLSKISDDYSCPLCTKGLSIINADETAIHHCHMCGLIIDIMCGSCNALEFKKESFRHRYIFGYQVRAKLINKIPYLFELGYCPSCNPK